jgi:hypothetical protein
VEEGLRAVAFSGDVVQTAARDDGKMFLQHEVGKGV